MEGWLDFARGPFLRFSFTIFVLGMLRNLVVTLWGVGRARQLTNDKQLSWRRVVVETFDWLVPVRHLRQRWLYSALSILLHVGLIVTPVFLFAHIRLVERNLGVSWPALPTGTADALTLATVAIAIALLLARVGAKASRAISRAQDVLLPLLLVVPFVTGFLAAHPHANPFSYNATMLVHVLSGDLCLLLVPFTKLSHMLLMPLARLPHELAWRFPDAYPEAVARQIGRKGKAV
jgi:nitrate reductase gamma subunit